MTYNVVIWGILGIAGLLLAISRMGFKKRLDWRIGIGIPLFGVSLFALATELPQYGIGFSILGTLIMAGAALMAIRQTEQKLGNDRRERKLIDIVTWANDVIKCKTAVPITPVSAIELLRSAPALQRDNIETVFKSHEMNARTNLIMRYQNLSAVSPRIVLMAKQLDKELGSNLEFLAQQTCEKLEKHVELGAEYIKGEMSNDKYKERWMSIVDSAKALAKKAEESI